MPLEVGDIILRDFELSLSFFTRTNKITPPPLNVQTCSTPIKIKIEVIMERLNWSMINLWNNKKLKVLPIQRKVRWYDRNKHIKSAFGFEPQIRFCFYIVVLKTGAFKLFKSPFPGSQQFKSTFILCFLIIYNKFANYFCELKVSGNTHQRH